MRPTKILRLVALAACSLSASPQDNQPRVDDMALLKAKAEAGDAKAELALGQAYESGRGVAADDAQAMQWYLKAAAQGDSVAANNIGIMYALGHGVSKDLEQAELEATRLVPRIGEEIVLQRPRLSCC